MNELEEQRVIGALQAITGGLTVTDRDLIDASTRIQHNLNTSPPRRNLALLAAAAAAVIFVGIVSVLAFTGDEKSAPPDELSPADTLQTALVADPYDLSEAEFLAGSRPTAQTMAGLWFMSIDGPGFSVDEFGPGPMYIDGNGNWRNGVPTAPLTFGRSTLAGDSWTRQLDDRSQCAKNNDNVGYLDQPGSAAIASDGSLHVALEPGVVGCTATETGREVWNRLAPGSPLLTYLDSVSGEIEWGAWSAWVRDESEGPALLETGVYVAPGTGHMLIVDADRSYLYYDNLTAGRLVSTDEGELDVDAAQGTVTATCGGGTFTGRIEAGRTPAADGYVQQLPAMRITTTDSGCGSDIAEQGVWLNLFGSGTGSPYKE